MLQKVILGLGSNFEKEINLHRANRFLIDYFEKIFFSEAVYTVPIGLKESRPFLNQVAIAYTSHTIEEVKAALKVMERDLGRTSESKLHGIIPIDIDLLQWNEQVLKPQDLERDYIKQGIASISR